MQMSLQHAYYDFDVEVGLQLHDGVLRTLPPDGFLGDIGIGRSCLLMLCLFLLVLLVVYSFLFCRAHHRKSPVRTPAIQALLSRCFAVSPVVLMRSTFGAPFGVRWETTAFCFVASVLVAAEASEDICEGLHGDLEWRDREAEGQKSIRRSPISHQSLGENHFYNVSVLFVGSSVFKFDDFFNFGPGVAFFNVGFQVSRRVGTYMGVQL